ncbi:MAG: hypothetical protein ACT4OX_00365, partial [Actinomycetota bacterium]
LGWRYDVQVIERATAKQVRAYQVCVALPDPSDVSKPPAPPVFPAPPTYEEIWASARLPGPVVGVNPAGFGITGLETWLWSAAVEPVVIGVSLGGFTVTGTATPIGYRFDSGEGSSAAASPGSEEDPAARHLYETKGMYRLAIGVTWRAEAVMTGPEIDMPIAVDLGEATITATRDYQVQEIVTQLVR